jgi:transposase InsO family protein
MRDVTLDFSRPGKPTDNAFAESFIARMGMEYLGQHRFSDLDDARHYTRSAQRTRHLAPWLDR